MHRTADRMTPSELAKCRENLKQEWENHQIDKVSLELGWDLAHRVPLFLYENYKVTKIAVCGSLSERDWFVKASDIDIAVWGISDDQCFDTIRDEVKHNIDTRIDLIDYERVDEYFRMRVKQQLIHIRKGGVSIPKVADGIYPTTLEEHENIYEKYKNRLIQYVEDGKNKIERILTRIKGNLPRIEKNQNNNSEIIINAIVEDIYMIYEEIAKVFLHIVRMVDMCEPPYWDTCDDILIQVAEQTDRRPSVVTHETFSGLKPLLEFHNQYKFHKIDLESLTFEDVKNRAGELEELVVSVYVELDTFIDYLNKT